MASEKVIQITEDIFDAEVLQSETPVFVDFWASWCGPCRMVLPILDQLADDFDGKAIVAKINVDEQPELAQKFNIMTIPTIMIFKNGELLETSGPKPKSEFEEMLNKAIGN